MQHPASHSHAWTTFFIKQQIHKFVTNTSTHNKTYKHLLNSSYHLDKILHNPRQCKRKFGPLLQALWAVQEHTFWKPQNWTSWYLWKCKQYNSSSTIKLKVVISYKLNTVHECCYWMINNSPWLTYSACPNTNNQ